MKLISGLKIRIFYLLTLIANQISMRKIVIKLYKISNGHKVLNWKMEYLLIQDIDLEKISIFFRNHGGIYLDGFLILNKYLHSMTSKNSIMILLLHKLETKFT